MASASRADIPRILDVKGLDALIRVLIASGRDVIGPTVEDDAIRLKSIAGIIDLPRGYRDEQGPGAYRLTKGGSEALFGYVNGAGSWKSHLHPERRLLWRAEKTDEGFALIDQEGGGSPRPVAFLGVRSCDLAAMGVLERALTAIPHPDGDFAARKAAAFVIAVSCGTPAASCFCTSMGTGPEPQEGFDLALTELIDDERGHRFLLSVGSDAGAGVLGELADLPAADATDLAAAQSVKRQAENQMVRSLDREGVPHLLHRSVDSPHWADVAERCLACGNCTAVCPTCFCSTVEDTSDLTGNTAERWQVADSCFSLQFSYVHGGVVRSSTAGRYRHWISHKLSTWVDQFGELGCVGCGRCITWCPVGIDITAEVAALDEMERAA